MSVLHFDFCYSRSKGSKSVIFYVIFFLSLKPHFLNVMKLGLYVRIYIGISLRHFLIRAELPLTF